MAAAPSHRLDARARTARARGRHTASGPTSITRARRTTDARHASVPPGSPLAGHAGAAGAITALALGGAAAITSGASAALPAVADAPVPASSVVVHIDTVGGVTAATTAAQVAPSASPTVDPTTGPTAAPSEGRTAQPSRAKAGARAGKPNAITDTAGMRTGGKHARQARQAARQAARAASPAPIDGCPSPDVTADLANGRIPDADLCTIPGTGQRLRSDAAAAWVALSNAYAREFGHAPRITDSYRSLEVQIELKKRKPTLAAAPGTSNHGLGIAVDLADGIERSGTAEHTWMVEHAAAFGWTNPSWAQPGGSKLEPWHWEYANPLA